MAHIVGDSTAPQPYQLVAPTPLLDQYIASITALPMNGSTIERFGSQSACLKDENGVVCEIVRVTNQGLITYYPPSEIGVRLLSTWL
jgi:hypothetical protein